MQDWKIEGSEDLETTELTTVFSDHPWLNLGEKGAAYNAWDLIATARVYKETKEELEDNRQLPFFEREVWPLVEPVLAMQRRGLLLDKKGKTQYRRELRKELKETDQSIFDHVKKELNLDSNPQVAELLYEDLGLKCHKLTEIGRKPSVDQEALTRCLRRLRVKDRHAQPVLEALFHRSKLQTIDERYLGVDVGEDQRVHPDIKLVGTETGRFAYADPPLQQFPDAIRHLLIASPGSVFVAADHSQLEARIMAHLSNDKLSLAVFDAGGDIHSANARDLFGYAPAHWEEMEESKKKEARVFAKSYLYRLMYGGSAGAKIRLFCPCPKCKDILPATVDFTREEIERADKRWTQKHGAVFRWRNHLLKSVAGRAGTGWYTNPLGRRRRFMGPYSAITREVYNMPMQSTAADIINRAMVRGHQAGLPFVLQMHDSLMIEVPIDQAPLSAHTLKNIMEEPVKEMGDRVFPVDVAMGSNWGAWDKKKNPGGLRPWTRESSSG
jgi:DNA polymerase-1